MHLQSNGDSMISGEKSRGSTSFSMNNTEKLKLSSRILELRKKIQNQEYIDNAIWRIAQVISCHLIEDPDELKFRD